MSPNTDARPLRILIVADRPPIHQDFRKIFGNGAANASALAQIEAPPFGDPSAHAAQPALQLDSAFQGQEALAMVREALEDGWPYAMAFMDVHLPPGWDGVETTARIWDHDHEIQIVVCTACPDYSLKEMHEKLGYTDRLVILQKPFDNVEVLQLAKVLTAKGRLSKESKRHVQRLEQVVGERTEQLAATKEQFRTLLESTSAVPWEMALETGACTYIGGQVESCWGWLATCFREPGFFHGCVHPDDRPGFVRALGALPAAGEVEAECRMLKSDGSHLHVRTLMSRGPGDGPAQVVRGVSIDLTEQKNMEAELRHSQKLESVGRLAAGIAHEINTPVQFVSDSCHFLRDGLADLQKLLGTYRATLQALARGETGSAAALQQVGEAELAADSDYLADGLPAAVERALGGLERVATIVRSMKDFAHADNPELAAADLNRAIQSTLTIARGEYKHVAEVSTDYGDIPPVVCHLGEINQVVLNIIVNAAHAIGDVVAGADRKGLIAVRTWQEQDRVAISISDTGAGIPAHVRDKIFDPFFTTKEVGKGTGQGLAIARAVVVGKHCGSLDFESRAGGGTTFTIRLPIDAARARAQVLAP